MKKILPVLVMGIIVAFVSFAVAQDKIAPAKTPGSTEQGFPKVAPSKQGAGTEAYPKVTTKAASKVEAAQKAAPTKPSATGPGFPKVEAAQKVAPAKSGADREGFLKVEPTQKVAPAKSGTGGAGFPKVDASGKMEGQR